MTDSAGQSLFDIADTDKVLPVTSSLSEPLREVVATKGTVLRVASRPKRRVRPLDR